MPSVQQILLSLDTRLASVEAENKELRNSVAQLQGENQELRNIVAQLQGENQELRSSVAQLQGDNQDLRQAISGVSHNQNLSDITQLNNLNFSTHRHYTESDDEFFSIKLARRLLSLIGPVPQNRGSVCGANSAVKLRSRI